MSAFGCSRRERVNLFFEIKNTSGNYCDKILIFQDVKKAKFSSPVQFLEEIKWLLHNAIIYFGGEQIFEMHLQYSTVHCYFSSFSFLALPICISLLPFAFNFHLPAVPFSSCFPFLLFLSLPFSSTISLFSSLLILNSLS